MQCLKLVLTYVDVSLDLNIAEVFAYVSCRRQWCVCVCGVRQWCESLLLSIVVAMSYDRNVPTDLSTFPDVQAITDLPTTCPLIPNSTSTPIYPHDHDDCVHLDNYPPDQYTHLRHVHQLDDEDG